MTQKNHKKEKFEGIPRSVLIFFCEKCPLLKKFEHTVRTFGFFFYNESSAITDESFLHENGKYIGKQDRSHH